MPLPPPPPPPLRCLSWNSSNGFQPRGNSTHVLVFDRTRARCVGIATRVLGANRIVVYSKYCESVSEGVRLSLTDHKQQQILINESKFPNLVLAGLYCTCVLIIFLRALNALIHIVIIKENKFLSLLKLDYYCARFLSISFE